MNSDEDWEKMKDYYFGIRKEQNVLEIIQKARSETVVVNAASYFLHPYKGGKEIKHKMLGNLLEKINKVFGEEDTGKFLCLKNEFPCNKLEGKPLRFDLMLEFEKLCIAIEAKVDSELKNNLDKYSDSLKKRSWMVSKLDSQEDENLRKIETILLITKKQVQKVGKILKEEGKETWKTITWEELMNGIEPTAIESTTTKTNYLQSLISSLSTIDKSAESIEYLEIVLEELNERTEQLRQKIKNNLEKCKIEIWKGEGKLRQTIEPRLVVQKDGDPYKIDICVGIRGIQFVIFKRSGYSEKLYETMCKEYSFYYWQDYLDHHALFDRYVISFKEGAKKGPLPVDPEKISVQQEDTIFAKGYDTKWIEKTSKKLSEIIAKLETMDS